jgi:hypothetical protein
VTTILRKRANAPAPQCRTNNKTYSSTSIPWFLIAPETSEKQEKEGVTTTKQLRM